MDRSEIAWLSRIQQNLDDTAMKMERNAKRWEEINQHVTNMIGIVEDMLKILERHEKEVSASNLCGSRRGNMDQRTTKK